MHWLTTVMYVLCLVIGLVTAITSMDIQNSIYSSQLGCSDVLQKANTGIIVLSTIMLTATVVLAYCSFTCDGAGSSNSLSQTYMAMYYGFMLVLSIVLTTLGALMRTHANDSTKPCYHVKGKATIIMSLGIIGIVLLAGPFAIKFLYIGGIQAQGAYKNYHVSKRSEA